MPAEIHDEELEDRLERLEESVRELDMQARGFELRLHPLETPRARSQSWLEAASRSAAAERAERAVAREPDSWWEPESMRDEGPAPDRRPAAERRPATDRRSAPARRPVHEPRRVASPSPPTASISDLVGGRLLAWIGGAATLLGIVLFLVVAISRGWIDVESRVALAAAGSAALMVAGVWLHSRHGRTEASIVLVGAGTAAMFATLVVAGEVYGLISPFLAVAGSLLVGALATILAIRWAGQAIGALGLLGALISPVLVGAPTTGVTVVIVGVAASFAMAVVVSQRWEWLGLGTVLVAAPQWGMWILGGRPLGLDLVVLTWFATIGIVGALGVRMPSAEARMDPAPIVLAALNACLVGTVGWLALDRTAGVLVGAGWLAALGAVHLGLGLVRGRGLAISEPLRALLITIGVIFGDVAFALSTSGITSVIGWGGAAIWFAWMTRRRQARPDDRDGLLLGVGAHIALTLIQVLVVAPPAVLGGDSPQLVGLFSIGILAAVCLAAGQLVDSASWRLDIALNALGLAAIAYLSAHALGGAALAAAWALEGAALTQLARRTGDDVARYGGLGFLGLAVVHALSIEAPPPALLTGVSSVSAAAIALGAVSLAAFRASRAQAAGSGPRLLLLAGAAISLLYLASVVIISAFQPTGGASITLLDLSIRQQGQVLLSICWAVTGLIGLVVGLRRDLPLVRNCALGLLLFTVGKVFLYDLSTLTALYRVFSFVALGLLLLAGAFAYQRLRPPTPPDMRSVHRSQR